jgi:outer membrane protein TolC
MLAQTTQARMLAAVHLYVALGGGWSEDATDRTQVRFDTNQ